MAVTARLSAKPGGHPRPRPCSHTQGLTGPTRTRTHAEETGACPHARAHGRQAQGDGCRRGSPEPVGAVSLDPSKFSEIRAHERSAASRFALFFSLVPLR